MSLTVIAATAESSAVSQSAKQLTPFITAETLSILFTLMWLVKPVFFSTIYHFSVLKESLEGGMCNCIDFMDTSSAVWLCSAFSWYFFFFATSAVTAACFMNIARRPWHLQNHILCLFYYRKLILADSIGPLNYWDHHKTNIIYV